MLTDRLKRLVRRNRQELFEKGRPTSVLSRSGQPGTARDRPPARAGRRQARTIPSMRFRIEQRFDASATEVCAALVDVDYLSTAMGELADIGAPSVQEQTRSGVTVRQKLLFRFTGKLPSAVTMVIDPNRLSWIEDTTIDTSKQTARFTMTPVHYASFFTCTGTWMVTAVDAHTSTRVIDGDLKVRSPVPFVGGQVEKAIVSGLRERLADEPAAFARWHAAR